MHFNRGWRLLREGDYAAAAQANAAALRLDRQCLPAHKNLLASLNNWAVALCAAQQYTQALEVLCAGQAIDGTFCAFRGQSATCPELHPTGERCGCQFSTLRHRLVRFAATVATGTVTGAERAI